VKHYLEGPPTRRHALVTGGTGDIGEAIVRRLVRDGFAVHATFHTNKAKAEALGSELGVTFCPVSAENPDTLPDIQFDTLINNVGINIDRRPFAEVPLASFHATLTANLYLPIYACQKYIPGMVEMKFGRIVNINSIYGLVACGGNSPYVCSKHAMSGLTKSIAHDYGSFGITSNEICPGPVESALIRRIASNAPNTTAAQYIEDLVSEIPNGRLAATDDVASLVATLTNANSGHLNGCSVRVDGGALS
jgi:NAD(P)-dependent dehydrogenase (short-subunit alcohol dehydrogenase family)